MISKLKRVLMLAFLMFSAATLHAQNASYKCMIQMNSYLGEGAYIVVSLINKNDTYAKTLCVLGPDEEWYPDLKAWHKAYKKKPSNLSAITRASVSGGDRAIITLEIEKTKINAGYKLRFESAVENKAYHLKDAELPLTTEGLAAKTSGKGYIKYVRFSGN